MSTIILLSSGQGNNPKPHLPLADVNHFVFAGQSLSVGGGGQPAISLSQPYSNLTFTAGPRSGLAQLTSLIALVENNNSPAPDGGTDRGETPCSGAANYITQLSGHKMLCSTTGHGGYSITQLDKYSAWYQYIEKHIEEGYNRVTGGAETYAVAGIGWLQGEADAQAGMSQAEYFTRLLELRKDIQETCFLKTGQITYLPLITYQLASHATTQSSAHVALAQLAASQDDSMIHIATPMYHFPYNPIGDIHLTNVGYLWAGHYFGRVMSKIMDGDIWVPLKPISATANGTIITVYYNVPSPPIVVDITTHTTQDRGFKIVDDTGTLTISNVQAASSTSIDITINRTLDTNPVIRYAEDYLAPTRNIVNGASGDIRDSDSSTFIHNLTTYNLYNWSTVFEMGIT